MRFFVDTEFINRDQRIYPMSIGIVAENGDEFYAVFADIPFHLADQFVRKQVIPYLEGPGLDRKEIAEQVYNFVRSHCEVSEGDQVAAPEFWGDYCAYDFVILSQIFGTFDTWPSGWPFFMWDLQQHQKWTRLDAPDFRPPDEPEHHALADARHIRRQWKWIAEEIARYEAEE